MKSSKKSNIVQISITFSLFIASFLILNSCRDTLDQQLYSSETVDNFYKSKKEAQTALNGVYNVFWRNYYTDNKSINPTDMAGGTISSYAGIDTKFEDFNWTSTSTLLQRDWTGLYMLINRANTLIDGINKSNVNDAENISGQAKFLRALSYFNLVKLFGDLPIYTQSTKDISEVNKPRSSVDSVYVQIENDLQDAVEEMRPYSESDHSAGKATSGAARALLVKVYAQQKKWSKAATTAKKVIDNNHFGLLKDFHEVLNPDNNNNKELIFGIQHGPNGSPSKGYTNRYPMTFMPTEVTTESGISAIFSHVDKDIAYQANESFFNDTPDTYRKSQTMRKTMPFYYEIGSSELIHETIQLPKPTIVKYYYLDEATGNSRTDVTTPVLRYSDVLLIYAESLNEINNGPTPAAYNAIDKVRARARGAGTPHEQPESAYPPLLGQGLTQSQFRDSVLTEEARELIAETYRRAELLRHNRFISNAKNRGINAQDYQKLYPIPTEEINRNDNLEQNPGY